MKKVDITISTINYNITDKLHRCIDSFLDTYRDNNSFTYEWYIIDNNSQDADFDETIKKYSNHPNLKFIKRDDNLGLAVLNTILDKTNGRYWLFLDPDTWQYGEPIPKLIEFMDAHPEVGIASAMQYTPHKIPLLYYSTHYSVSKVFFVGTSIGSIIDKYLLSNRMKRIHFPWSRKQETFNKITEVDQVSFACTLERMELLKEDGYVIDPDFSFIFNDVDLCKRVKDKNLKIMILPSAKIIHDHSSAYKKTKMLWKRIITIKAQIKYFHKYHPYKILFLKLILFFDLLLLIVSKFFWRRKNLRKNLFLFQLYQILN